MEKIGIFCSASENIDKMYFESARQIGEWMGQKGKTLIYGGASLGLMECVARAVKEKRRQGHRSCSRQTGGERQSKHSVRRRNSYPQFE